MTVGNNASFVCDCRVVAALTMLAVTQQSHTEHSRTPHSMTQVTLPLSVIELRLR